jgi:hypothetical protein
VNIFIVKDSITRHADYKVFFSWSFWKFAHIFVQYVPRKITCIEEDIDTLLNTTSLWLNHIAHNMAYIPTRKFCLSFGFIPYTQPPNMCLMLLGGGKPETKWITLHINLVRTHSKKRCCMVSWLLQKLHISFLCQFLLTKLFLVSITFLYNSHKKTLIFKGILIFQR